MPESGFLQGFFLDKQLKATHQNVLDQIAEQQRAQTSSQDFNRQQNEVAAQQWAKQFALQKQQADLASQSQQYNQQANQIQLMLNGVRPAGSVAPSITPDITSGAAHTPFAIQPDGQPIMTPNNNVPTVGGGDIGIASGGAAPTGQFAQLGGQRFLVPDAAQRAQESEYAKNLTSDGDVKRRIATVDAYISKLGPNVDPAYVEELRSKAFFGFSQHDATIDQGIQTANTEYYNAMRVGDQNGMMLARAKRQDLVDIKNSFFNTQAVGRQDQMKQLQLVANTQAAKLDSLVQSEAVKMNGGKQPSSTQLIETMNRLLANKQVLAQLGINDQTQLLVGEALERRYNTTIQPGLEQKLNDQFRNPAVIVPQPPAQFPNYLPPK